jgi:hypothetical protein
MKASNIEFDESAMPNTKLFSLPFDGASNQIDVRFKSNELNDTMINTYFRLDFKNFLLKTSYNLDEIQIDLIELVFICTATSSSTKSPLVSNTFLLYITINDVNNKVPEFIGQPFTFSIKEVLLFIWLFRLENFLNIFFQKLTQTGTIAYQNIKAIDRDLPNKPNSQISFSIVNGSCSDYFEFPLTTKSDLAIKKVIHYEIFNECSLIIKAEVTASFILLEY